MIKNVDETVTKIMNEVQIYISDGVENGTITKDSIREIADTVIKGVLISISYLYSEDYCERAVKVIIEYVNEWGIFVYE